MKLAIVKGVFLMGLLTFLSGCASQKITDYSATEPKLDLQEYFTGPIKAWGLVQDRTGKVVRRFDVLLVGTWENDVGTLEEHFDYYDGETEKRTWIITKLDDNKYKGTAGDIIGEATGQAEGSALQWAYQMDIDVGDNTFRLTFDDWMYLMNDGILMNRSYLKKFGLTVAELTLVMQKQDEPIILPD